MVLLLVLVLGTRLVFAAGFEGELQSAEAYLDSGRYQDALKVLKKILGEDPKVAEAHFLTGEVYREAGQTSRSRRYYKKALEYQPQHKKAAAQLYEILRGEARGGGLVVYEKVLRSGLYLPPLVLDVMKNYAARRGRKALALAKRFLKLLEEKKVPPGFSKQASEALLVAARVAYRSKNISQTRDFLAEARHQSSGVEGLRELEKKVKEDLKRRATPAKLEGDRLARERKFAEAISEYQKALDIYPDWSPVRDNLLAVNSLVEAERLYTEALELIKLGKSQAAMGKLVLGLSKPVENLDLAILNDDVLRRLETKRTELEAIVKARKSAERRREEQFATAYGTAEVAARSEDWVTAAKHYREAVDLSPNDERAIRKLEEAEEKAVVQKTVQDGVAAYRKRNYRKALSAFEKAEERVAADAKLLRYLALCHFYLKDYEKAEPLADQALSDAPSNKQMLYVMGVIQDGKAQRGESRPDTPIGYLEKIESQDPDYLDIGERLSRLRWQRDRTITIAISLGLVLWAVVMVWYKYRPTILKNRFLSRVEGYSKKEKWDALAQLEDDARSFPLDRTQDQAVNTALAQAFYHTKQWQKAISWTQLALEKNRENPALNQLMGRIYFESRIISQDVVKYLVVLADSEPDNVELLRFIGEFCLDKQLVNDKTMPILRNLAMSMPQNDRLRRMLIRGYLRTKDTTARALALYRVELKKSPDRVDLRYFVAADTFRAGRTEEAIQHCEKILNIKLNHPETHTLLRGCYEKLGKLDELARIYQGILENDPYNPAVQDSLKKILNST
jgi:tetratricopeptide (TPR) repeat protein